MERWKGSKTEVNALTVTREDVEHFAEGIQEDNRIYFDVLKAQNQGFQDIPIPITMPVTFWKRFTIPWLEEIKHPPIHAKQGFTYHYPLVANRTYEAQLVLHDVYEKMGSKGQMVFLEHTLNLTVQEELHAQVFTTLIVFKEESS